MTTTVQGGNVNRKLMRQVSGGNVGGARPNTPHQHLYKRIIKTALFEIFSLAIPLYLLLTSGGAILRQLNNPHLQNILATANRLTISTPDSTTATWFFVSTPIFTASLVIILISLYHQFLNPRFERLAIITVFLSLLTLLGAIGFSFGSAAVQGTHLTDQLDTWGKTHLGVSDLSNYVVKDAKEHTQYLIKDNGKPVRFLLSQHTANGITTTIYQLPETTTK